MKLYGVTVAGFESEDELNFETPVLKEAEAYYNAITLNPETDIYKDLWVISDTLAYRPKTKSIKYKTI
ncbi:hypothetical protein N9924_00900 [bacterium]|nr:hypothetical protein [bacterium]